MARTQYSPQFKTKLVLEVLGDEKELGTIAYENNINPNMLRSWKREFLDHASEVFENPGKAEKQARRKEESLKKVTDQMLKTIILRRQWYRICCERKLFASRIKFGLSIYLHQNAARPYVSDSNYRLVQPENHGLGIVRRPGNRAGSGGGSVGCGTLWYTGHSQL